MLLDTGYLFALVQPRDALHVRARRWAAVVRGPLIVTEYVLREAVNALSAPVDRPKAHQVAGLVRAGGPYLFLPATPALLAAGLQLHAARPDKEWSLTDCISFHVMQQRNLKEALAHDRHFAQAGFEPLMQRDP